MWPAPQTRDLTPGAHGAENLADFQMFGQDMYDAYRQITRNAINRPNARRNVPLVHVSEWGPQLRNDADLRRKAARALQRHGITSAFSVRYIPHLRQFTAREVRGDICQSVFSVSLDQYRYSSHGRGGAVSVDISPPVKSPFRFAFASFGQRPMALESVDGPGTSLAARQPSCTGTVTTKPVRRTAPGARSATRKKTATRKRTGTRKKTAIRKKTATRKKTGTRKKTATRKKTRTNIKKTRSAKR